MNSCSDKSLVFTEIEGPLYQYSYNNKLCIDIIAYNKGRDFCLRQILPSHHPFFLSGNVKHVQAIKNSFGNKTKSNGKNSMEKNTISGENATVLSYLPSSVI